MAHELGTPETMNQNEPHVPSLCPSLIISFINKSLEMSHEHKTQKTIAPPNFKKS